MERTNVTNRKQLQTWQPKTEKRQNKGTNGIDYINKSL